MKKIIVIGCMGSGKSTFAEKRHRKTKIPLFHLDNIWWKADRTHISREEFDSELNRIIQGDSWIIDGDYNRTYAARFEKCDTVIFLDYSEKQCMEGLRSRVGKVRADMPWVENELSAELVELVKGYRVQTRPKVLELIAAHGGVECRIFNRREQADAWLRSLPPQL